MSTRHPAARAFAAQAAGPLHARDHCDEFRRAALAAAVTQLHDRQVVPGDSNGTLTATRSHVARDRRKHSLSRRLLLPTRSLRSATMTLSASEGGRDRPVLTA